MSHTALSYHIVLSTYRRCRVIDQDNEKSLYRFIYEFLKKRDIVVRRINGMPDHVHILCDIPAKYSLADIIRTLKAESSKYARHSKYFKNWEGWSEGYGAFTVSFGQIDSCVNYIMTQKEHHSQRSFEDEYRNILRQTGMPEANHVSGADE